MDRSFMIWLMCGLAIAAALPAAADYNNEIDVGILPLFIGNFNARYERNINGYFSAFAGAGFSPQGYLFADYDNDEIDWTYVNVNGGAKFFPLGGFRRLFVQAEVNGHFNHVKNKTTGAEDDAFILMPGALVGWRWIIAERATLTLAGGSGYATEDIDVPDGEPVDFEGVRPRLDLNLGFLF